MADILIVYYSLSGNTKKLSEFIAEALKADIIELKDNVKRKGFLGFLKAGYQAMKQKKTGEDINIDVTPYKTILVGTPVWAWKPAPVINNFLSKTDLSGKRMIYFATAGNPKMPGKTFTVMSEYYKPVQTFIMKDKMVKDDSFKEHINNELHKIVNMA